MFSLSIAFFHGIEWFWCKVVGWFVFFGLSESRLPLPMRLKWFKYTYTQTQTYTRERWRKRKRLHKAKVREWREKNLSASINPILDVIPRKTSELILSRGGCCCCCVVILSICTVHCLISFGSLCICYLVYWLSLSLSLSLGCHFAFAFAFEYFAYFSSFTHSPLFACTALGS